MSKGDLFLGFNEEVSQLKEQLKALNDTCKRFAKTNQNLVGQVKLARELIEFMHNYMRGVLSDPYCTNDKIQRKEDIKLHDDTMEWLEKNKA